MLQKLVDESLLISADSAGSKIDAPVIADNSIKIINKRTSIAADTTVVDILHKDKHDDRVRAAGVDPSAFRHINEAGEDVEV